MAENKPSISLTIALPNGATRVLEFNSHDPIMVGSGASSHVRLEGDDVSALHCMIKPKDDGHVAVLDLGSDDGTELNGRELSGETNVDDGDVIRVGRSKITVHFGGAVLAPTVPIRRGIGTEELRAQEPTLKVAMPELDTASQTAPQGRRTAPAQPPAPVATPAKRQSPTASAGSASGPNSKPQASSPTRPGTPHGATPMATSRNDNEITTPQKEVPPMRPPSGGVKRPSSMEPRVVHRETSKSGFLLGKGSRQAHRSIGQTAGRAARLSPALADHEKPQGKGNVDVTATWGGTVIGVTRVSGSGTVSIGHLPTNDFQLSHASIPSPTYALVSSTVSGVKVNASNGMEATVDGRPVSGSFSLDVGQRATVRVGPVDFVIQYSKRYAPIDLGLFQSLDYFYSKIFALALILQLGLITAFVLTPHKPSMDDDDLFKNPAEFAKLILTPPEKKKEKKEDLSGKKAAKHKDDEGQFGKKDKPKEDKLASKKGAPTVDKDKREEDRKMAMDALAALGIKGPEGAVSDVFGPGGLGTGINSQLGGLRGASMGDAGGAGGLGSRGTGAGGGGTGLGIGGLGSGTGRGSGGNGNVDLGGRGKGMTRIVPGKIIYEGGLSREEIQRVISRVMSQIKYCYEKELTKDPNLEGKLVMSWVITGTGDVTSAQAAQNTFSGASATPIDQCVTRIVQRLKFPNPKGGGQVFVTYPFVFSSSGG